MLIELRAGDRYHCHRITILGLDIFPSDASPAVDRAQGGQYQAVRLGGPGLSLPAAASGRNLHLDGIRDERLRVTQVQGLRLKRGSGLA